jgi:peptide deformylase
MFDAVLQLVAELDYHRGVPALLKIVQAGDPVLRRQARALSLEEIRGPRVQGLVALMRETMRDAPGVGLAAPQIGESIQLAVIEDPRELHGALSPEQLAERERSAVPFHVLINPKLAFDGDEMIEAYEGCLSFASFMMIVPRARRVRVEALDENGEPVVVEASGWYARILQHEIDHLRGVLCCDRMNPRTLATAENHARYWRSMSVPEALAAVGPKPPE